MTEAKSLKVWLLVTHALILVGMGHGIATVGIIEGFRLTMIFDKVVPTDPGQASDLQFRLFAVLAFLGQFALLVSFWRVGRSERILHWSGLILLWLSFFTLAHAIRDDPYTHLATWSCLPFLYFTIKTIWGEKIVAIWRRWVKD